MSKIKLKNIFIDIFLISFALYGGFLSSKPENKKEIPLFFPPFNIELSQPYKVGEFGYVCEKPNYGYPASGKLPSYIDTTVLNADIPTNFNASALEIISSRHGYCMAVVGRLDENNTIYLNLFGLKKIGGNHLCISWYMESNVTPTLPYTPFSQTLSLEQITATAASNMDWSFAKITVTPTLTPNP